MAPLLSVESVGVRGLRPSRHGTERSKLFHCTVSDFPLSQENALRATSQELRQHVAMTHLELLVQITEHLGLNRNQLQCGTNVRLFDSASFSHFLLMSCSHDVLR